MQRRLNPQAIDRLSSQEELVVEESEIHEWTKCFFLLLKKLKCRDLLSQKRALEKGKRLPNHRLKNDSTDAGKPMWFMRLIPYEWITRPWKGHNLERSDPDLRTIQPRRLLLKSPCHTGRVKLLLELFPDAKFVYIHRDPYEVFLSGAHMASTTYGYMFLQRPTDEMLQEYILSQGEILIGEYNRSKVEGLLKNGKVRYTIIHSVL